MGCLDQADSDLLVFNVLQIFQAVILDRHKLGITTRTLTISLGKSGVVAVLLHVDVFSIPRFALT